MTWCKTLSGKLVNLDKVAYIYLDGHSTADCDQKFIMASPDGSKITAVTLYKARSACEAKVILKEIFQDIERGSHIDFTNAELYPQPER